MYKVRNNQNQLILRYCFSTVFYKEGHSYAHFIHTQEFPDVFKKSLSICWKMFSFIVKFSDFELSTVF